MREHTALRFLDGLRFGPMHRRVWWLSAMGIMLDGFDFFIIGVASPLIVAQWSITPFETGLLTSAAVLGAIVGAAVMGPLSDRIGRKIAFRIDLAMFVVFSLASAFAPDIWWLIAFRFLLGVGIGADYPIAASYVSEISPRRLRPRLLIGAFSFQAVGQLLGALVGLAVLLLDPHPEAWRWMLAAGVVPATAVVILRRVVPESPMWLASQAKYLEAAAALSRFAGRTVAVSEIHDRSPSEGHAVLVAATRTVPSARRGALFSARHRAATVLTSAPWFLMDIATYGVGVFTPTILAALALGSAANTPYIADDIVSTEGAAVLDIFLVVGFAAAILLVRRLGLVAMQSVGFFVMAGALVVLGATELMEQSPLQLAIVFLAFAAFNLFMNAGPNATTFAMPTAVFPVEVRGAGAGFAAAAGKAGAAVGTFFFPQLQAGIGLFGTLSIIAAGCAVAGVVTIVLRRLVSPREVVPDAPGGAAPVPVG